MTSSTIAPKTDYVAVIIAYLSFVVLGIPGAMLGIAWTSEQWPSIQKTFGLGLDAVGALFITQTIGYSLASVFGGRLFGRYNASSIFFVGAVLSGVALLAYAFAGCGSSATRRKEMLSSSNWKWGLRKAIAL